MLEIPEEVKEKLREKERIDQERLRLWEAKLKLQREIEAIEKCNVQECQT